MLTNRPDLSAHTAPTNSNLQVGYGWGQGEDAFAVGKQAAEDAARDLLLSSLAAVLVFASIRYDLQEVLQGIHSVVGEAPLLGATTAGEICDRPLKESVVVVALASPFLKVRIGVGQGVSQDWRQAVTQALTSAEINPFFTSQDQDIWSVLTRQGKSAFGLLFSPGNTRDADSRSFEILEELKRLSHGRLPIIGGAAADDWHLATNYVLWGCQAYPDSVLVAVFETQLRFGIAMAHGFQPSSSKATVTQARQHEVLELDGKPAAEVYSQMLGLSRNDLEGKHLTLTSKRPAGILDPYGQYSLNVASFFTPEQGVRFSQPVVEGTVLTIMEAEKNRLIAAGGESVHKAVLRGSILDPALILTFPCALRSLILENEVAGEIDDMHKILPATPIAGFYSFGEQALADDGVNRHNNEVIATLVLDRELSYGAQVALENAELHHELEQRYRQLNAQQSFLQTLIDTMPSPIFYKDASGKYLGCNHAFEQMFGKSRDEIIGKYVYDMGSKEIADKYAAMDKELFEHPGTQVYEWKIKAADGLEKEVIFYKASFLNAEGKVAGLVGAFLDITERKRAEEALQESENRYRSLVENIDLGITMIGTDYKVIMANAAQGRIFQKNSEEFIGKACFQEFEKRDRVCPHCPGTKAMASGQPALIFTRGFRDDGSSIEARIHAFPTHGPEGEVTGFIEVVEDITDYKRAEESLRKSEERYRSILKTAMDGFWRVDLQGRLLEVNEAYCQMSGFSEQELLDMSISDLEAMEMVADTAVRIQKILAKGDDRFETRHRRKDGKIIEVEISVQYNPIGEGSLAVFIRDITARKQAEEALANKHQELQEAAQHLEQSRNMLHRILESIPVRVFWKDLDSRYMGCNTLFARDAGLSHPDELLGQDDFAMGWKDQAELYRDDDRQVMESCRPKLNIIEPQTTPSGGTIWLNTSKVPLTRPDGEVFGVLGIYEDITARKQMEEALALREQEYRTLLENIPDLIVRYNLDLRPIYVNSAWEKASGLSAAEILHKPAADIPEVLHSVVFEYMEELRQVAATEIPQEIEFTWMNARGETLFLQCTIVPEYDRSGNIVSILAVGRDQTERKQVEEERVRFSKLESLGTLAGGIAHDFNNILTAILGNISLAQMDLQGETAARETLKSAEHACQKAQGLAQQLLTFARGGAPIKKLVDVKNLATETGTFTCRGSNVRITFNFPDDLWAVEADPGQIGQVIQNLVLNGLQAMPTGGTISVKGENLEVAAPGELPLETGKYVKISIQDQGVGIPAQHLFRIFDPYFTTKQTGSGLGLATAYSIVKNHGGHIAAESTPRVGTTFHIYLPAVGRKIMALPPTEMEVVGGQDKILVMDDEEMVRNILASMLGRLGYEFDLAGDGGEALKLFTRARESGRAYDAVILDLTVPGEMGGKETLTKLLEIDPQVKAIVSSGYSDDPIMAEFAQYGFKGVIAKPYRITDLSKVIAAVIAKGK